MPPWDRYRAAQQQQSPQAAPDGSSLAQRGQTVQGPWAARAQSQGAARVQQRQEQTGEGEVSRANTSLQLLAGLGRARRLIEQDTPTGPMAENWGPLDQIPGSMEIARALPGMRGVAGVPSTQQLTNLGELEKLSTLAATAVAGATTTGMDANTRAAIRSALFGVDRSQGENRRNVNYLLQQYVNDAIATRAQQAWRNRYGDVNAVDPATGMNVQDYIAAIRPQLPSDGDSFERRNAYNTRVVTRNGATLDLPEVGAYTDNLVAAIRGELGPEPAKDTRPRASKNASPAPQIGATRTFPNGRIGVWDGHGWRAQ